MIPYYTPHVSLSSVVSFFKDTHLEYVESYFKEYTGKRYVLLTHSCRSALYLAFASLGMKGEIITTPLTCKVALIPIIKAGFIPKFADIETDTLNISPDEVEKSITNDTIAIQLIHFAGNPSKIDEISIIAKKRKLLIIEDCAQSFGSMYRGKNVGRFGDISCFALTKNVFGISGGVLATDDADIYKKALSTQLSFQRAGKAFIYYRLIRGFLESRRTGLGFDYLYRLLMISKNNLLLKKGVSISDEVDKYLKKPDNRVFNITASIIRKKIGDYLGRRRSKANKIINSLNSCRDIGFQKTENGCRHSYGKLFIHSDSFNSHDVRFLNSNGIEAKHLEQDYQNYFQMHISHDNRLSAYIHPVQCKNYNTINDRLVSLPLHESLTDRDIIKIRQTIIGIHNERSKKNMV